MSITYDKESKIFNISTKNTSYLFAVTNKGILLHIYYGKKIKQLNSLNHIIEFTSKAFSSTDIPESDASTDLLPMEYPCYGSVDLRTPAFNAIYEDGSTVTVLSYKSHEIIDGKPELKGLPSTYVEDNNEAQTLIITMHDSLKNIDIKLYYTAFNEHDAIAKHVEIVNTSTETVSITSALSSSIDFHEADYDFVHLHGAWARERHIQRVPLINGNVSVDSKRGSSSHHHNPFFALASKNADEDNGEVYGFNLIYSGNFIAGTEVNAYNTARAYIGLNPFNFCWQLKPAETFVTPETVLVYSDNGFGKMSRTYHKLYRTRLAKGKYRDTKRPVLINNWEATYFDFNEEKILNIAKKAKEVGVELMVLDDGWFGKRDIDNCSLGDWVVDKNKLPDGIGSLATKINDLGMKFGLWFEPEMVSPDSDLYRAHPDWCLHVNGRKRNECRNQLILDLSRDDVCDYIIKAVSAILKSAPISYVKWDMNRNMSEIGSALLPANQQREVTHRYMLGLYRVLETITSTFPDILFESCSGGGGRFDGGMMYYMPQCWTSDNTDAIERLYIQHGTSLVYPVSSMGAHVSAVPNHQTGRTTDIRMRGDVATFGRFGYELDLSTLTDEEICIVKEQIIRYHELEDVIHHGEMYRLKSPYNGNIVSWEFVSDDNETVILAIYTILCKVQGPYYKIKLKGLDADAMYTDTVTGTSYAGDVLMNIGYNFDINKDFNSEIKVFKKIN